ncbi:MAG: hypothetical protein ACQEP3_00180 [Patescibacteria group bacterium]
MKKEIIITITICGLALLLVYIGGLDSTERKNILAQLSSSTPISGERKNKDNNISLRDEKTSTNNYSASNKEEDIDDILPIEDLEEGLEGKKNFLKEKSANSYENIKKSLFEKTNSIEGDFKSEVSNLSTTINEKLEDAILKEVCKNVATD